MLYKSTFTYLLTYYIQSILWLANGHATEQQQKPLHSLLPPTNVGILPIKAVLPSTCYDYI